MAKNVRLLPKFIKDDVKAYFMSYEKIVKKPELAEEILAFACAEFVCGQGTKSVLNSI